MAALRRLAPSRPKNVPAGLDTSPVQRDCRALSLGLGATLAIQANRVPSERLGAQHGNRMPGKQICSQGGWHRFCDGPGRKIVGKISPRTPCFDDVPQGVEHRSQGILSLRSVFCHQRQIRHQKLPFVILDVAGIRLPRLAHDVTSTNIST